MLRVSFLDDSFLDASVFKKRDGGLLSLSDGEDVLEAGGEGVVLRVFHVHNVEAAWVLFEVRNRAHTTNVVSARDHHCVARLELVHLVDFLGFQVELDRVVRADIRVRESDGTPVVCHQVRNLRKRGCQQSTDIANSVPCWVRWPSS